MFHNFIYFIVVLLIYTTYQPSKDTGFTPPESMLLAFCLLIAFAVVTWLQFRRLAHRISEAPLPQLDHRHNAIITRQAVLAILVFAINIYGLNLTSLFSGIAFFQKIPTLQALIFLSLFVGYLSVVWYFAHDMYRRLYQIDISKWSYVSSNILFAVPVLLPWFFLSIIADIINILPFRLPKSLLATPEGQVGYFLFFLFGIAVVGPVFIRMFWRCTPLEIGNSRSRIQSLCEAAGIKYADILYWPIFGGRLITAGVMGLTKKFRYILVTDALLRYLEPEEIDAVIAHEIGHVRRKHLVFYLFFFVGYLLVSYALFDLFILLVLYSRPVYRIIEIIGIQQPTALSVIFSLMIIILFLIYFRYIFGYFMRNFERQADTFVYTLFNSADALITTLKKIATSSGQSPDRPNWHHFSITERIAYLEKCELDRTWIHRHDKKVRKSITAYLIALLFIGAIGYQLNFGEAGKQLNAHFLEKIVRSELEKTPHNAKLYSTLGDLYFARKQYAETIEAYAQAIKLQPENAQVLNNLAWLYATCEDERFRNPKQALKLAEKAANIEQAAHVLDTLAESYFINGMLEAAIDAEKEALRLAKKNRTYYEDQLKKFRGKP